MILDDFELENEAFIYHKNHFYLISSERGRDIRGTFKYNKRNYFIEYMGDTRREVEIEVDKRKSLVKLLHKIINSYSESKCDISKELKELEKRKRKIIINNSLEGSYLSFYGEIFNINKSPTEENNFIIEFPEERLYVGKKKDSIKEDLYGLLTNKKTIEETKTRDIYDEIIDKGSYEKNNYGIIVEPNEVFFTKRIKSFKMNVDGNRLRIPEMIVALPISYAKSKIKIGSPIVYNKTSFFYLPKINEGKQSICLGNVSNSIGTLIKRTYEQPQTLPENIYTILNIIEEGFKNPEGIRYGWKSVIGYCLNKFKEDNN